MSKDESNNDGLLSKVVRFVRNPTVNWNELDNLEAERESQYSKQMLKEMIERKRRNDFVRKREFDHLRKLRQRDTQGGQRLDDPAVRPSFLDSGVTTPDDRAGTLKKIDEIEAQMSQQWWRNKPAGATAPPSQPGDPAAPTFAATAPMTVPGQLPGGQPPLVPATGNATLPPLFNETAPPPLASTPAALSGGLNPPSEWGAPARTAVPEEPAVVFQHDPDLEEAAIRFASGDHVGAEAGLREVLAQSAQGELPKQHEIWMTLFDLYRATDQREPFDALSIDYAARFGRSAPLWLPIGQVPEARSRFDTLEPGALLPEATAPAPAARSFTWSAPSTLTLQSVAMLQAVLGRTTPPWVIAWTRLMTIEEAALPALAKLLDHWADQDVQMAFVGVEALQTLLLSKTPSEDRSISPEWWRLRMTALRLMGRLDEFEMVALDYCITYEVSPPSWVQPRCVYAGDDGTVSGGAHPSAPESELLSSNFGSMSLLEPESERPQLVGCIDGDAGPLLESAAQAIRPGQPLVIGCEHLVRMDFPAAGSVLNWAAQQQAAGQVVQFINLHRLVAVLFNVIGINEHAWVIPRKN